MCEGEGRLGGRATHTTSEHETLTGELNDDALKARTTLLGESQQLPDRLEELLADRAASATILQLHRRVRPPFASLALDELRVYVDRRHVIDDDADAHPFLVFQHVLQQRGLARTEEAAEQRDRRDPR